MGDSRGDFGGDVVVGRANDDDAAAAAGEKLFAFGVRRGRRSRFLSDTFRPTVSDDARGDHREVGVARGLLQGEEDGGHGREDHEPVPELDRLGPERPEKLSVEVTKDVSRGGASKREVASQPDHQVPHRARFQHVGHHVRGRTQTPGFHGPNHRKDGGVRAEREDGERKHGHRAGEIRPHDRRHRSTRGGDRGCGGTGSLRGGAPAVVRRRERVRRHGGGEETDDGDAKLRNRGEEGRAAVAPDQHPHGEHPAQSDRRDERRAAGL